MKSLDLVKDGNVRAFAGEPEVPIGVSGKRLSAAAMRALEEAKQRRLSHNAQDRPKEVCGPGRLDPVRYGDWEKNGLISDF